MIKSRKFHVSEFLIAFSRHRPALLTTAQSPLQPAGRFSWMYLTAIWTWCSCLTSMLTSWSLLLASTLSLWAPSLAVFSQPAKTHSPSVSRCLATSWPIPVSQPVMRTAFPAGSCWLRQTRPRSSQTRTPGVQQSGGQTNKARRELHLRLLVLTDHYANSVRQDKKWLM